MTQPGKALVKSDKATVLKRVNEVLRILLAGGEFEEIRQYSAAHGWDVSDRQLRRYQEKAYSKLAQQTKRDQKQLLGRHLMQRRALYARAIKEGDYRGALHVLRDEAELEGLYELAKQEATSPQVITSPLSKKERFRRLLAARAKDDEKEARYVEETSPHSYYKFPDTRTSELLLYTMTLMHVAELLDNAAMVFVSMWNLAVMGEDKGEWEPIGELNAWLFKTRRDGWQKFCEQLDVDPDWLIDANHQGTFLDLFTDRMIDLCPTDEALRKAIGRPDEQFATADDAARKWRKILDEVLDRL